MKLKFLSSALLISIIFITLNCKDNTTDPIPPDTAVKTSLEPDDGTCLFIIGQSNMWEMEDYIAEVDSEQYPAGFAFYTSLSGSAIQSDLPRYIGYLEPYPNSAMQLAIWTGERQWGVPGYYLDEIVNGKYDANIKALAEQCKAFGKPIYIRFGYEFDGWHNAYPPQKYISAYKYFVDMMNAEGVKNTAYVWHSWGVGAYYGDYDYPDYYPPLDAGQEVNQSLWYPGDEYVDWVAMSVFGTGWGSLATNDVVQYLISFAEEHKKPVMLAESAAIKTSNSSDPAWVIPSTDWFRNVFSLIKTNKSVKAFTYINTDWEAANSSSTWGDTRVQAAPIYIQDYWKNEVKNLQHGTNDLFDLINFTK